MTGWKSWLPYWQVLLAGLLVALLAGNEPRWSIITVAVALAGASVISLFGR